MTLKECIKKHYQSQKEYAERWGFTEPMVSRWIKKGCLVDSDHWPHPKLMKRVTCHKLKGE